MDNLNQEEFITGKEIAQLLKVSGPMAYIWAKRGMLPHYRMGRSVRFRKSDVKAMLDRCRIEGK